MCWTDANRDALLLGGSVVTHYHRRIQEQEERPDHEPVSLSDRNGDG